MMTNTSTHVTAMDCIVCENMNFDNREHKAMQASPILPERCCTAPANCTPSSSFPSQERNFLQYVSALDTCFSGLHISHACFIQALLLAGFGPAFTVLKQTQMHFWNVYLYEHILALWSPRMCKINFFLLYSLWHLFSFPPSVPGGGRAALPLALEVMVWVFFKAEGEGVNSRGFL